MAGWDLKKFPENLKQPLAKPVIDIETESKTFTKALMSKVKRKDIETARIEMLKAEARIVGHLFVIQGQKAKAITVLLKSMVDNMSSGLKSVESRVKKKDVQPKLIHAFVELADENRKTEMKKLGEKKKELSKITIPEDFKRVPPEVAKYLPKNAKDMITEVKTARNYLLKVESIYKGAEVKIKSWMDVYAEGA